ncbi:MAG: hypothetical protein LBD15_03770 [Holosporales bacterium]|nr:hypothetical protein [Holosporales bacterium]
MNNTCKLLTSMTVLATFCVEAMHQRSITEIVQQDPETRQQSIWVMWEEVESNPPCRYADKADSKRSDGLADGERARRI